MTYLTVTFFYIDTPDILTYLAVTPEGQLLAFLQQQTGIGVLCCVRVTHRVMVMWVTLHSTGHCKTGIRRELLIHNKVWMYI